MRSITSALTGIFCLFLSFGLIACGSDGGSGGGGKKKVAKYTIGGTVSGLEGSGLVLLYNVSDYLTITADGTFTFNTTVANGEGYNVEIASQPTSPIQTCTVNNGSGTVHGANVKNVTVTCSGEAYTISGTATGITNTVVLQDNGGDDLTLTTDGIFTFMAPIANGAGYAVTVLTQPSGQTCLLDNRAGIVNGSDVTDVSVTCGAQIDVGPLYPNNGANWNDYVQGSNITGATDTACDAATDTACLHGGEMRAVEVPGRDSCTGLTASDALRALDWTCDNSTGSVRMVSIGLKKGKHLSDLLDFSGPGWKDDSVTVFDGGGEYFSTSPAVWWSNPVTAAGSGGSLSTAGTIYVVTGTDDLAGDFTLGASKVGLVAQPGAIINGPGTNSYVVLANGSSTAKDFLWLEGDIDASGDLTGVMFSSARYSRIDNLEANNASSGMGVQLFNGSHNTLSDITANNNQTGISVKASNSTLRGITASNNAFGVFLDTSSNNNTLSDITTSNNLLYGIYLFDGSSNNTLSGITAANNGQYGVLLHSSSNNTLSGITAANNGQYGVFLALSSNSTLSGITAANNAIFGVYLNGSSNNTLSGITAANNNFGIFTASSSSNYFTGPLKVGNNPSGDCYILSGSPGLTSSCANSGSSDATLTKDVTLASSFVGKIYNDTSNSSDTGSAVAYPADPATFDWSNFENQYRVWGKDGTFGTAGSQGQWISGNGAIWDWSVTTGDAAIKNALMPPTGDDILIHLWLAADSPSCDGIDGAIWGPVCSLPGYTDSGSCTGAGGTWGDACYSVYLRNAVEISSDGVGDDNLLCESDETCLYTPNIASYQGHGNLVSAGTFTDGTITGVTLLKYDTNGR